MIENESPYKMLEEPRKSLLQQIESANISIQSLPNLVPTILKAQHLAKLWKEEGTNRSSLVSTDSMPSVNVYLYMSKNDDIALVYLFMETHAPKARELSTTGMVPYFRWDKLWIYISIGDSEKCKILSKEEIEIRTKQTLVCL